MIQETLLKEIRGIRTWQLRLILAWTCTTAMENQLLLFLITILGWDINNSPLLLKSIHSFLRASYSQTHTKATGTFLPTTILSQSIASTTLSKTTRSAMIWEVIREGWSRADPARSLMKTDSLSNLTCIISTDSFTTNHQCTWTSWGPSKRPKAQRSSSH